MEASSLKKITALCAPFTDFSLHSRIHKMRTQEFYIKRDDELGFGVSGSKLRKYASLLPWIKKQEQKTVALTGSPYSNHILSLVQLFKQDGIPYHLFLEKPRSTEKKGNFFFLSLLCSQEEITWIEKIPSQITASWMAEQEMALQRTFLWIPLGGAMKECFLGSLTLALDILENEKTLQKEFSHIFIDSGTGTTAAALIAGMAYLQKKVTIHVVLLAGNEQSFVLQLSSFLCYLEDLLQEKIPPFLDYEFLIPVTAKSFGSCNQQIFQSIVDIAQAEGIFLDPIYTSKLLLTAIERSKKSPLIGNTLLIHSGGALSLCGFTKELLPYLA